MSERVHAVVQGRVQGVSFRYYTVQEAHRLRLVGWVRNRLDGTVEVVAEGVRPQLDRFVEFLHRGSPAAMVDAVDTNWSEIDSETYTDFMIR